MADLLSGRRPTPPTQSDEAATPAPILGRGASIARYVLIEFLGGGGMGMVYLAYDPSLDRRVALKLVRAQADAGASASGGQVRLLREAQAMAQLSHPNVRPVFDVGQVGDQVFIAMEFVEGRTLDEWVAVGRRS